MKSKLILIIFSALLLTPITASGQVTDILKKKTKNAARGMLNLKEKLLNSEKDTANIESVEGDVSLDNSADVVDEGSENKREVNPQRNPLAGLFSGGDVKHKNNYDFTTKVVMEMKSYNSDDGSEGTLNYISFFNPSNGDMAISFKPAAEETGNSEMSEITMIYDIDNNISLVMTVMGSQKTAMATSMDDELDVESVTYEEEAEVESSYRKTGQTKNILGYKCDEYEIQDGGSTIYMWVTREADFGLDARKMEKAGMPVYYDGPFEGGMVMEMVGFEEGVKKLDMRVTEIDTKTNQTISLNGYSIMSLNLDNMK